MFLDMAWSNAVLKSIHSTRIARQFLTSTSRLRFTQLQNVSIATQPDSDVKLRPVKSTAVKQICRVKENDGSIKIEGRYVEGSGPTSNLVVETKGCCPLCSLNIEVDYTDVLILRQFIRKDGTMLPRRDTGLCAKQQLSMAKLVHKAANAGLLYSYHPALPDGKVRRSPKESRHKFVGLNRYFTDQY